MFINLDSRPDRLTQLLPQLRQIGVVNPVRVPAVHTSNGAIGCTMSHIRCIEIAQQNEWPQVCIVEDDFRCVDPARFRQSLAAFAAMSASVDAGEAPASPIHGWSVLMLGGNNVPPYTKLPGVDCCVRVGRCLTTVAYIVRRHAYSKVIQNLRDGVALLLRNPDKGEQYACDVFYARLQAEGDWYLLTPLTVTQLAGHSDIERRMVDYDRLMLDLDKGWRMSPAHAEQVKVQFL